MDRLNSPIKTSIALLCFEQSGIELLASYGWRCELRCTPCRFLF